jgi:cell division septation protein DedD
LHGKQLVFVFMAATVAAVVVFLSGVMVGRGVRLQLGGLAFGEAASDPTVDEAPPLAASTGPTEPGPSPASGEDLTYPSLLSESRPPDVHREPAEDPTAEVQGRDPPPVAPPVNATDQGSGYAVQVAAVRDRAEADRIAARLSAKGYRTYVTSPAPGMFRVRVGMFANLQDAETTAARLEKEERFNPWVTK